MEHNLVEKIVDAKTGQIVIKEYSPQQIAEVEAAQVKVAIKTQELADAEAKRSAAAAKLEALGLDEGDLKALGL